MKKWIALVYSEIINTPNHLIYGYDWLAFGHYTIAISFWGVYRNAKQNLWIVEWAMINSFLIIPFALTFGHIRGIPFWWQMVDCSFGVGSLIILFYLRNLIQKTGIKDMEKEEMIKKIQEIEANSFLEVKKNQQMFGNDSYTTQTSRSEWIGIYTLMGKIGIQTDTSLQAAQDALRIILELERN
jgi:predicted membrane protein